MSPYAHSGPSRSAISSLLGSAAALFAGRFPSARSLRGVDPRTLADIGIEHVGQGPATLQVAATDTGSIEVSRSFGTRPVD